MNYIFHLLVYLCMYAILALSLNLIMGYCGLITLAHASYFAVGAYAYALASLVWNLGFLPAILIGIAIASLFSLAVSLPAWRFKADGFVLVSLAVQALVFSILYNWHAPDFAVGTWQNLTNGPFGISGIPRPVICGYRFDTPGSMLVLSVCLLLCCTLIYSLLVRSPWGRLLKAIRDDEIAARGLGKNVRLAKVHAFAIACGMASMGGAIYASYVSYIDPNVASLDTSILLLCMAVIGGLGNQIGPLVGAVVLVALPETLRLMYISDINAPAIRLLAYGLLLTLLMHFRPQGIAGEYRLE